MNLKMSLKISDYFDCIFDENYRENKFQILIPPEQDHRMFGYRYVFDRMHEFTDSKSIYDFLEYHFNSSSKSALEFLDCIERDFSQKYRNEEFYIEPSIYLWSTNWINKKRTEHENQKNILVNLDLSERILLLRLLQKHSLFVPLTCYKDYKSFHIFLSVMLQTDFDSIKSKFSRIEKILDFKSATKDKAFSWKNNLANVKKVIELINLPNDKIKAIIDDIDNIINKIEMSF